MIGVDVGGTFTDVVAVRDGRIEVTKVPSDASDPATAVVEGARRLGVQGSAVFNHASTMGLNAVITRRLPKVAFLTTEGFRDILDRGTIRRPLDGQTDPAWRRSFGDAARPLVPRYLRRGVVERMLADGSELRALDADQARRQLAVLRRCEVQGVAICLLNAYVNPAHEQQLRELTREVLGDDVAVSISSETSPLAKEYARASTTVIDVLMKLIFGRYSASLDADLRELGFEGDLNFADCAATLLPWREALEKPFRIVFAGPAAGTISSTRLGAALGDRQPAVRRRRRHLDRRLARRRRRAVRQRHLRDRARPDHQRAVDRGVERRRRRRQHRVDLAVGRRPRRARERGLGPRPGVLRARRHGADADRRLPADGHPRSRPASPAARCAWIPSSRGARSRRSTRRSRSSSACRSPTASPSPTSPRRSPTSPCATASTRATSRSWPTVPPVRCSCPPRSTCCRSRAS